MSLVLRTLEAFPGGRTTEEILALLDVDFDPQKRLAVIAGLDELAAQGVARRGRDGKWKVLRRSPATTFGGVLPALDGVTSDELLAVPARFEELPSDADAQLEPERAPALEPSALLRYWRAALRADPRGAITQVDDRHGVSWQLVTGAGSLVSDAGNRISITLELDHLADEFRQALPKRQAKEQCLAIGWPIAVGRKSGVPAIWPVGLLSAEWTHRDGRLEITLGDGGVMTNPDWVKAAVGKIVSGKRQERAALKALMENPVENWNWRRDTACAAFLLSRSDTSPLLLDREQVDLLGRRVLLEFQENIGSAYTAFNYAPFLLVGLLRWRLKELRAVVASSDPLAREFSLAVDKTLADLEERLPGERAFHRCVPILNGIKAELEGQGTNPDLLLDIYKNS